MASKFRSCFDFIPDAIWKGHSKLHPARADELPPVPEVDIELKIRNTGKKTAQIWVGGDFNYLYLTIEGPERLTWKSVTSGRHDGASR